MVSLMKSALIISKTETSVKSVAELLEELGYPRIKYALNAYDARKQLRSFEFELVIINAPLTDENGLELSAYCAENTKASVILTVPAKKAADAFDIISERGVLVMSRPLNRRMFKNCIVYSAAYRDRLTGADTETEKLKNELEEIKVINRAKLLLIQCLSMTETQAHRYIEKQAMNMRTSKLNIAKQVIRTYQN